MKIKNVFSKKTTTSAKASEPKLAQVDQNSIEVEEVKPIFEDFELQDTTPPEKVRDAINISKRKPFERSPLPKMPSQNFDSLNTFDDDDDEEDDDDFADIEKSYQEFLARRKRENSFNVLNIKEKPFMQRKESEYTLKDFEKDFIDDGKDINELLIKMPEDLKDTLLKILLGKNSNS